MARILIVFRPRTGGTFSHVRLLSAELARRGHEVAVCGPDHGPGDVPGEFDVPRFEAPIPRGFEPAATARAVKAVGAAYRSFAPDLIHAHGPQAGVVARLARPACRKAPLIYTPHRYPFLDVFEGSLRPRAYRAIERALMPVTTHVLCVCEDERRIAEELGAGGRSSVVHNGIEPLAPVAAGPEMLDRLGVRTGPGGPPLVVAVAELFPRKGVTTLLEAAARMAREREGLRVIVAGGGPDEMELRERVRAMGLERTVLLAGHVEDVPGLLSVADVFVNPAWFESFPYGVLEAMSIGTPCVVTDAGGVSEAVVDGRSGLVVPPRDGTALAIAIGTVLDDRESAERRAREAASRVRTEFSRARMFDGTEQVYERVLAGDR